MARLPRLYAADTAQLVQIQLQQSLFDERQQINQVLKVLRHYTQEVQLHAWSCFAQEIYLLLTPQHAQAVPVLVQQIGRHLAGRQGAVFKRRYRSCLVQNQVWILPVMQWMEAYLVTQYTNTQPLHWQWSSLHYHLGDDNPDLAFIHNHRDYMELDSHCAGRHQHYQQYLAHDLYDHQVAQIEQALYGQWVLANENGLADLSGLVNRRMQPQKQGRKSSPVQ